MQHNPQIKYIIFIISISWLATWANAGAPSSQIPCGFLENFMGDVRILNPTRTQLIDAKLRTPIACGSWVSVYQGWAQIRHQNGPRISLGEQTFVQLIDFRVNPKVMGDHFSLYRGTLHIQSGEGEEALRILSPAGRARVKNGKSILLYNPLADETQLISLEGSATLENRFEPSRKVVVHPGEATQLDFKLLRVIPSLPAALSVASLRPKLTDLRVSENEQLSAVRAVLKRQSRKWTADRGESKEDSKLKILKKSQKLQPITNRTLASEKNLNSYLRHPSDPMDLQLHSHWIQKLVGGEKVGEQLLYPNRFYGKSQKLRVEVEDPGEKFEQKRNQLEDLEKRRLIDELSQIHSE